MSDVRVRKLQEFIKQEVSQMLMRGLKDPRIGFTTVTDVHVTGDLREATIYVSLFGSDKEKEDTLIALKHASGRTLKPITIALDADANMISDSLIAPTAA